MKVDLHVHSDCSDGEYSVDDLLLMYEESSLDGFALTDHDNIDGILKLREIEHSINVIYGIEFSCLYNDEEVHILGLNLDVDNTELRQLTNELKLDRVNRAKKIIYKLKQDNIELDEELILSNNSVGRPHIARELCKNKYAKNMGEAFDKFLLVNSKYYVERRYLTIEEAVNIIKKSGGISVLAHPGRLKDYRGVLEYMDNIGVDGIEVYHPSNSNDMTAILLDKCKRDNYFISGGSDFHKKRNDIGKYFVDINLMDLER